MRIGFAILGGLALAAFALAISPETRPATPVQIQATINAVRVIPQGDAMPGMHLDIKVDGRVVDVYVAPISFVTRFDIKLERGMFVLINGFRTDDTILPKSITTGVWDKIQQRFHEDTTFFMRDDRGPFWAEPVS